VNLVVNFGFRSHSKIKAFADMHHIQVMDITVPESITKKLIRAINFTRSINMENTSPISYFSTVAQIYSTVMPTRDSRGQLIMPHNRNIYALLIILYYIITKHLPTLFES
jgi:hypothetical protein